MKIEITGIGVPINAVRADLGFDAVKLEAVDVSTDGSFANIFVQKEISNKKGYVRLTGGLPNPGFTSGNGVFGTVFFKGKSAGLATIEYLPTSLVLANDGRGSDVLEDLGSVSYLILPERISEEEAKVQKSAGIKSNVLGENINGVQIKFYEENSVLEAKTGEGIQELKSLNILGTLANVLLQIDRFVLQLWQ